MGISKEYLESKIQELKKELHAKRWVAERWHYYSPHFGDISPDVVERLAQTDPWGRRPNPLKRVVDSVGHFEPDGFKINETKEKLQELVEEYGLTHTDLFIKAGEQIITDLLSAGFRRASPEQQLKAAVNIRYPADFRIKNCLYYLKAYHRLETCQKILMDYPVVDDLITLALAKGDAAFKAAVKWSRSGNSKIRRMGLEKLFIMHEKRYFDPLCEHFQQCMKIEENYYKGFHKDALMHMVKIDPNRTANFLSSYLNSHTSERIMEALSAITEPTVIRVLIRFGIKNRNPQYFNNFAALNAAFFKYLNYIRYKDIYQTEKHYEEILYIIESFGNWLCNRKQAGASIDLMIDLFDHNDPRIAAKSVKKAIDIELLICADALVPPRYFQLKKSYPKLAQEFVSSRILSSLGEYLKHYREQKKIFPKDPHSYAGGVKEYLWDVSTTHPYRDVRREARKALGYSRLGAWVRKIFWQIWGTPYLFLLFLKPAVVIC